MKIIVAPAKKMRETDLLLPENMPVFLEKADELRKWICTLSYQETKKLWNCNDKIAKEAYERFHDMDLRTAFTPAVLSYDGIQYQYMAPAVMAEKELAYLKEHLRILSGFYGILRPMDSVCPYRLEMQAKTQKFGQLSLYDYWGDIISKQLCKKTSCILNLASKEYSLAIEPYLPKKTLFITCIFGDLQENKVIVKGTKVKMARGEMVRFLAENKIEDLKEIKKFERLGYHYEKERSDERTYIFVKS